MWTDLLVGNVSVKNTQHDDQPKVSSCLLFCEVPLSGRFPCSQNAASGLINVSLRLSKPPKKRKRGDQAEYGSTGTVTGPLSSKNGLSILK